MRIIAGKYKNAQFDSPHSNRTHPMSDRARGGLFNALGDLSGLTVFDPFGGTGALAFEALSRGAKHATICELDKAAQKTIAGNIEQLGLSDATLYFSNTKMWLRRNRDARFDVVLADPPYDDIDRLLLQAIADRTVVGGIFVLSWPGKEKHLLFENQQLIQSNRYGDAKLLFFRRT